MNEKQCYDGGTCRNSALIEDLEQACADSHNHNAGVIDRIVEQLREAGYTGTLSEMVEQACELKEFENYVESGA